MKREQSLPSEDSPEQKAAGREGEGMKHQQWPAGLTLTAFTPFVLLTLKPSVAQVLGI